jgi:hypothetical protein
MSKAVHNRHDRLYKDSISSEEYVLPILSQNEAVKLILFVDDYITSIESIRKYYRSISSSKEYRNRGFEKKITIKRFHKEVLLCWDKLPKGFVKDLYKLYFNKLENLKFNNESDLNHIRFKMLERSNNTLAKILTEGSQLKSFIFTRSIILFHLIHFAKSNLFNYDGSQFMDPNLELTSDLNVNIWEEQFEQLMEDPLNKKLLQISLDYANKDAVNADRLIDKTSQNLIANGTGALRDGSKVDSHFSKLIQNMASLDLAYETLNDWIQIILEKSKQYFKENSKIDYELLLESDNPHLLKDFYYLHPSLQNLYLEEIQISKPSKNYGLNLYIDISGSMNAITLKEVGDQKISSLDFAKAIAVSLANQQLLNQVYLFNHNIIDYKSDEDSLVKIEATGGTNISSVISHINENERNALVITDAMDRCNVHTPLAFILGVKGANFSLFSKEAIHLYCKYEQIVLFDGNNLINHTAPI